MRYWTVVATCWLLFTHSANSLQKRHYKKSLSHRISRVGEGLRFSTRRDGKSHSRARDDKMDGDVLGCDNSKIDINKEDGDLMEIGFDQGEFVEDDDDAGVDYDYDYEEGQEDWESKYADLVLSERARKHSDPTLVDRLREACLIVAVDATNRNDDEDVQFTLEESLNELSELVGTAGLTVKGVCVQRMSRPSRNTYVGPGKIAEVMEAVLRTEAKTLVIDDDLSPKQQRGMEVAFAEYEGGEEVKILDRTAVILEIFAQHAQTKEGKLQVELAQMQYRLTRGPRQGLTPERDSGAGFRGPGESKVETDKRSIRDRIVQLKKEIAALGSHRENNKRGRDRLGLPLVALVGYTNAGKSTILNRMTQAGVLAENMLFATLDSTVRRVRLSKELTEQEKEEAVAIVDAGGTGGSSKGQEILLTDTVGFISKLPADLVVAFRSTLEQVVAADVLVHVCDRSNPMWRKQREVVLAELAAVGCTGKPIVELWNKVDLAEDPQAVMQEAHNMPLETDLLQTRDYFDQVLPLSALEEEESEETEFEETKAKEMVEVEVEGQEEDDEYAPIREGMDPESLQGTKDLSRRERRSQAKRPFDSGSRGSSGGPAVGPLDTSEWHKQNEKARRRRDRESTTVRSRQDSKETTFVPRNIRVVAASAKSGLGFHFFVSSLEDALSIRLTPIKVFIPYDKDDGLIDVIHTSGKVDSANYGTAGTSLVCRVPEDLYSRLLPFREREKEARQSDGDRSNLKGGGW